jgi:hypothetical protein
MYFNGLNFTSITRLQRWTINIVDLLKRLGLIMVLILFYFTA